MRPDDDVERPLGEPAQDLLLLVLRPEAREEVEGDRESGEAALERPEAVEAGTAKLIGTRRERIVEESLRLLDDETHYRSMSRAHNPYGDGKANDRIVEILRTTS